jgi:hypothetical protein
MIPYYCPICGSEDVWLEDYIDAGAPAELWRCEDCGYEFIADDPADICEANDGIIDDEDTADAPPADSRDEEVDPRSYITNAWRRPHPTDDDTDAFR